MPFKAQFDESRAPVFTPEVSTSRGSFDASADAELARAMQQSMGFDGTAAARDRAVSYSQYSSDDVLPVAAAAVEMLTSALDNATIPDDVKNNDLIKEIVQQCDQLQAPLAALIERSVVENLPVRALALLRFGLMRHIPERLAWILITACQNRALKNCSL